MTGKSSSSDPPDASLAFSHMTAHLVIPPKKYMQLDFL